MCTFSLRQLSVNELIISYQIENDAYIILTLNFFSDRRYPVGTQQDLSKYVPVQ